MRRNCVVVEYRPFSRGEIGSVRAVLVRHEKSVSILVPAREVGDSSVFAEDCVDKDYVGGISRLQIRPGRR
jgi:hypothetical protein